MPLVYMRGYQNFMPFPCLCMLRQLDSVLVSLLRGYFLVLMVGLHIMLIGSSVCLAPQLLCGLHFFLDCLRLTMQTTDKLLLCLFKGSYRYVMSGSLLGVELKDIRSVPVGYMAEIALFEGDFFILFIPTQLSKVVLKRCHNIHGLHPLPY